MREGGKTKFTLRACELIAKKLASLDQVAADAVVNLSVESGWVGMPDHCAIDAAHAGNAQQRQKPSSRNNSKRRGRAQTSGRCARCARRARRTRR